MCNRESYYSSPVLNHANSPKVNNDDTQFNVTWQWKKNQDAVHAFPNVKMYSSQLPVQLKNLSSLNFEAEWSMAPSASSEGDLAAITASADVVMDMFLDPDMTKSQSTTLPEFEVMVWMGQYGFANPIGHNSTKAPATTKVNGTTL
jgi:xyloglucan-specific endo-beta-1,4-glucanase